MTIQTTTYTVYARTIPVLLTSVPILVCYFLFIRQHIQGVLPDLTGFLTTEDITFGLAFIYLLTHLNRLISKRLFQNELRQPSTEKLLLTNKAIPRQIKQRIRGKIEELFDIQLLTEKEEIASEEEARSVIGFAVAQMREYTRKDTMIHRRNIEYGFIRNFLGGCVMASVVSFVGLIILLVSNESTYSSYENTFAILLIIYLLPLFFRKTFISKMGEYYQETLFEQFLAKKELE